MADFPFRGAACAFKVYEVDVSLGRKWTATMPVSFIEWTGSDEVPLLGREPWFRKFRSRSTARPA